MADLFRAAWRQIWRAPGFSLTVIGTLALTIGASTALISILNGVVLRSLPIEDPDALVVLQAKDEPGRLNRPLYYQTYVELARLPVFSALEMYSGGGVFGTEVNGVAGEGIIEAVTPGFYETLGLRPYLGRYFSDDDAPGDGPAAAVAVISYDFWQRYFAGDPRAVGSHMLINLEPVTVVGVTPPEFKGMQVDSGFGFAVPLTYMIQALGTNPSGQPPRGLQAVGRLRPRVALEQARAAVTAAWPALRVEAVPARLPAAERAEIARQQMTVAPIGRGFSLLRERYRSALVALAGITVLLWVIGCTNLSGLLLSRLTARRREIAVCLALGATRGALVRRWTAEGLLLSLIGTALAYPLARAASVALVSATWTGSSPLAISVEPDARVLALMAAMASVTAIVMAALPGWMASARAPLAGGPGSRTITTASGRSRRALLVTQVAISLVLLFGASVFATSLLRLRALDLGVDTAQPRFTRLFAVPGGYDGLDFAAYYPALARSLEELPGMRSVAFSSYFPAYWNFPQVLGRDPVARAGAPGRGGEVESFVEFVSPAFFETVGVPLLAGRDFTWHDDAGAPGVVVVNELLAAKLFPDGDIVGRHIRIGDTPERSRLEVVGVAKDATLGALRVGRLPMVFRPRMQEPRSNRVPIVIYRADGDPAAVDDAFRRTVAGFGHEYARATTRTFDEELDIVLLRERLLAWLSGLFAVLALLLVFIGLFAALAFAVTQRAREIGVRMAIGAPRRAVVAMIVREALLVVGCGSAIGVVVSLAAARVTRSLVFDLDPVSPGLALAAAAVFVLVAVAASLWPAHRAASIDPATALRAE